MGNAAASAQEGCQKNALTPIPSDPLSLLYVFSDATELDSLLCHATALQDLSLETSGVYDSTLIRTIPTPPAATVVLASLKCKEVEQHSIDDMLAAFSAVDIKHLISLDLRSMRTSKLLLVANSQTLQKLHYCCMAGAPAAYSLSLLSALLTDEIRCRRAAG